MATMLEDWPRRLDETADWAPATSALEADVLDELEWLDDWEQAEYAESAPTKITLPNSFSGWQPANGVSWADLHGATARDKEGRYLDFFQPGRLLYRVQLSANGSEQVGRQLRSDSYFSDLLSSGRPIYIGKTGAGRNARSIYKRFSTEHFAGRGALLDEAAETKLTVFGRRLRSLIGFQTARTAVSLQYGFVIRDSSGQRVEEPWMVSAYELALVVNERPHLQL